MESETNFNAQYQCLLISKWCSTIYIFFILNYSCISSAHLRNLEPIPHHRANTHTVIDNHPRLHSYIKSQQPHAEQTPRRQATCVSFCSATCEYSALFTVECAQLISQVSLPPARHGSTCHHRTIKHKHESCFTFRTYNVSFLSIHVCVCWVLLMTAL